MIVDVGAGQSKCGKCEEEHARTEGDLRRIWNDVRIEEDVVKTQKNNSECARESAEWGY